MSYTLCTGGTGLLGQFLLMDLLRARIPVAVLARPGRAGHVANRIEEQLKQCESRLQRVFPRPVVLCGELTSPELALSCADQRFLENNCERVLHSAAMISFKPAAAHPRNEPFTTNVEGTRRLANFCLDHGISEFHHISSAFACGLRSGLILESEGDLGQQFSNDYEASKSQAEKLLRELRELQLTIYRPSIVVDPTPGSLQMGDRTIYLAFSIYQLIAKRIGLPAPGELLESLGLKGSERKNIVPAAWVSRVIVQILRRPNLHGRTYHLTHPTGTTLLDLITAFQEVLAEAGHSPLKQPLAETGLEEYASVVDQFVQTFTPYFRDDPNFDQTHLLQALEDCQESHCPNVQGESLRELAREQMTTRSEPSNKTSAEPSTHWGRLQTSLPSVLNMPGEKSSCRFGLILSGQEGGDWLLELNEVGELYCQVGGGETMESLIYSSAQTWNQLLCDRISLEEASQQGRLHLESASHDAAGHEQMNQLRGLLEVIRERLLDSNRTQKVSLYGN